MRSGRDLEWEEGVGSFAKDMKKRSSSNVRVDLCMCGSLAFQWARPPLRTCMCHTCTSHDIMPLHYRAARGCALDAEHESMYQPFPDLGCKGMCSKS